MSDNWYMYNLQREKRLSKSLKETQSVLEKYKKNQEAKKKQEAKNKKNHYEKQFSSNIIDNIVSFICCYQ